MRYLAVKLLYPSESGTDILGNPVVELSESEAEYRGRFTVWTAEEIALVGRDVTQAQRKLLTDAAITACRKASGIRIGEEDYAVKTVKDLNGRWRMLYIERCRQK